MRKTTHPIDNDGRLAIRSANYISTRAADVSLSHNDCSSIRNPLHHLLRINDSCNFDGNSVMVISTFELDKVVFQPLLKVASYHRIL